MHLRTALVLVVAGCKSAAYGMVGTASVTSAESGAGELSTRYIPSSIELYVDRRAQADLGARAFVDDDIQRACGIPEPERVRRFEPDSAQLGTGDAPLLEHLAACLASGRLGDRPVSIIGFTDPRGAEAYNQALGLYRAEAVRLRLVELGVPKDRLVVVSRGEHDAVGVDPATWALDRRVEIHLVDPLITRPAPARSGE